LGGGGGFLPRLPPQQFSVRRARGLMGRQSHAVRVGEPEGAPERTRREPPFPTIQWLGSRPGSFQVQSIHRMKSPFPGMDPYLERHWLDIHTSFVTSSCDSLKQKLPANLCPRRGK